MHSDELPATGDYVLCHLADIQDGKARGFLPERRDDRVFVVRRGAEVYVYLNRCPHEWVSLDYAKDKFLGNGDRDIICFAHGAHFDIEHGRCFHGPCAGKHLIKVPHRIDNGEVIITLPLPASPTQRTAGPRL